VNVDDHLVFLRAAARGSPEPKDPGWIGAGAAGVPAVDDRSLMRNAP
jgi:hypothetical protein